LIKLYRLKQIFVFTLKHSGLKKMGHGGADFFTMNNFVRAVANGEDQSKVGTGVLVIENFLNLSFRGV
jgi:hypothetical protein